MAHPDKPELNGGFEINSNHKLAQAFANALNKAPIVEGVGAAAAIMFAMHPTVVWAEPLSGGGTVTECDFTVTAKPPTYNGQLGLTEREVLCRTNVGVDLSIRESMAKRMVEQIEAENALTPLAFYIGGCIIVSSFGYRIYRLMNKFREDM